MSETATTYDLRIERLIPATPEEVFDAYTNAEKMTIWFGLLAEGDPGVIEIASDVRVGGIQTNVWGPNRDHLYKETNTFTAIDRPHRLVMTSIGSAPEMPDEMTTEIEVLFEEAEGGTLVKVHQTGITDPELRDFFLTVAWPGGFDRIVAYFQQ